MPNAREEVRAALAEHFRGGALADAKGPSRPDNILHSKTARGIAEVPLTPIAADALRSGSLFRDRANTSFRVRKSQELPRNHLRGRGRTTLKKAGIPYFRIDLRSTYATRLSVGGVAEEWVSPMLRQGDAQVMKSYCQMKLQMKDEASGKLNRFASEKALAEPELFLKTGV